MPKVSNQLKNYFKLEPMTITFAITAPRLQNGVMITANYNTAQQVPIPLQDFDVIPTSLFLRIPIQMHII